MDNSLSQKQEMQNVLCITGTKKQTLAEKTGFKLSGKKKEKEKEKTLRNRRQDWFTEEQKRYTAPHKKTKGCSNCDLLFQRTEKKIPTRVPDWFMKGTLCLN